MIITEHILQSIFDDSNIHIIIHGSNIAFVSSYIQMATYKVGQFNTLSYRSHNSYYYIDVSKGKQKKDLINLLKEICSAPNFYSKGGFKKKLILVNFDKLRSIYQQSIKTIIDTSYLSCIFILHGVNLDSIDKNILSRFLVLSLPTKIQSNLTTQMTMDKLVCLLKKPITKNTIDTIREICYMYYMDHTDSVDLQRLIVKRIGSNYYIPNPIKYDIIEELSAINHLYQYSYRKPIFLELIIYSLFKHLKHYTTNLT